MGNIKKEKLDKMKSWAKNNAVVWVSKDLEDYTDDDKLLPFVPLVQKEVYGPHGGERDKT